MKKSVSFVDSPFSSLYFRTACSTGRQSSSFCSRSLSPASIPHFHPKKPRSAKIGWILHVWNTVVSHSGVTWKELSIAPPSIAFMSSTRPLPSSNLPIVAGDVWSAEALRSANSSISFVVEAGKELNSEHVLPPTSRTNKI